MIKFFQYVKDRIRMLKYIYKKNKIIDAYFKELEEDIKKAEKREKAFNLPEGKDIFEIIKTESD